MSKSFLGKGFMHNGKRYKFVPQIESINADNPCFGCVFDRPMGEIPTGCETNPSRKVNEGNCDETSVIIHNTKQGLADYISKRLGHD